MEIFKVTGMTTERNRKCSLCFSYYYVLQSHFFFLVYMEILLRMSEDIFFCRLKYHTFVPVIFLEGNRILIHFYTYLMYFLRLLFLWSCLSYYKILSVFGNYVVTRHIWTWELREIE